MPTKEHEFEREATSRAGFTGTLRLHCERGGTVSEIAAFLVDLDAAYLSLYNLERSLVRPSRFRPSRQLHWPSTQSEPFEIELWHPSSVFGSLPFLLTAPLPEDLLSITKVNIESPGFWEFVGSLNPLQQVREYLNDRHKRRQDKEFREKAEKEKLMLENELIQRAIWEKENAILADRINILRGMGYSKREIRHLVWDKAGKTVARLARYQDTLLIGDAEISHEATPPPPD
jgi:hypothetical protein